MPSTISFGVYFRKVTELGHAGGRIHKISSTLSKVIGDGGRGEGGGGGGRGEGGGEGEGALQLRLIFCKIVCHDSNIMCFA